MEGFETLGQRVTRLRKKKGLTLDGLAALANKSKTSIWTIENKTCRPAASTLYSIATILGVSMEYLLTGIERKASQEDMDFFRRYLESDDKVKKTVRCVFWVLGERDLP